MTRGRKPTDKYIGNNLANSQVESLPDTLIARALAPFGVQADPALAGAIRQYAELLLRWNQKISLTSITRPEEILQRHFGESLFAARAVPIVRGRLVDVGSGAGFPGLALKLISPELKVTLVEPSVKKSAFLAEVARSLGLTGVKIVSKRIEDLDVFQGIADFVTCRAVRPDRHLLQWMRKALADEGRCVLWLGRKDAAALKAAEEWHWQEAVSIPKSESRVLLVGRRIAG